MHLTRGVYRKCSVSKAVDIWLEVVILCVDREVDVVLRYSGAFNARIVEVNAK